MEILVIIMGVMIMIIPSLHSPYQGGSNGGEIIQICFFMNLIVNNESIVSIATRYV
jgi:hypothetical protein